MKISYYPLNLAGAEKYLSQTDKTADTTSIRDWLEQATAKVFAERRGDVPDFVILQRGLGFFWGTLANTSAPLFRTEVSDAKLPDLIDVTYWVAADAVQ